MLPTMAATRLPFRVGDSTPRAGTGDGERPLPAKGEKSTMQPGKPLPTPSQATEEAVGHGHSPRIPWGPAKEDARKPMKLRG